MSFQPHGEHKPKLCSKASPPNHTFPCLPPSFSLEPEGREGRKEGRKEKKKKGTTSFEGNFTTLLVGGICCFPAFRAKTAVISEDSSCPALQLHLASF